MMTQSEAEKQITKILAQLEKDQGVVIDAIEIRTFDCSNICQAMSRKRAAITLSYLPNVSWDVE